MRHAHLRKWHHSGSSSRSRHAAANRDFFSVAADPPPSFFAAASLAQVWIRGGGGGTGFASFPLTNLSTLSQARRGALGTCRRIGPLQLPPKLDLNWLLGPKIASPGLEAGFHGAPPPRVCEQPCTGLNSSVESG